MATETVIIKADAKEVLTAERKIQKEKKRTAQAARKVATDTRSTGTAATAAGTKFGGMGTKIAGALSIGALVATAKQQLGQVYQLWREEMDQTAEKAKQVHDDILNLTFLGEHFKDPKLREWLHKTAREHIVPGGAAEVATGYYALESATAELTDERRKELFEQMLTLRRTMTVPLEQMAPLMADPATTFAQEGLSATEIGNVVKQTIESAKVKPESLVGAAPRVLGAGRIGRMSYRETMALFARATKGWVGTPEEAATAMENLINYTMFVDLPEEEKQRLREGGKAPAAEEQEGARAALDAAGILPGDDFLTRIRKLEGAEEAGQFGKQAQFELFGKRGMRLGAPMLERDLQVFDQILGTFMEKTGGDRELAREQLRERQAIDPTFRATESLRQAELRQAELRDAAAKKAMHDKRFLQEIENDIREERGGHLGAWGTFQVWRNQAGYRRWRFLADAGLGWPGLESGYTKELGDYTSARDPGRRLYRGVPVVEGGLQEPAYGLGHMLDTPGAQAARIQKEVAEDVKKLVKAVDENTTEQQRSRRRPRATVPRGEED